jgi:hypothetical protein
MFFWAIKLRFAYYGIKANSLVLRLSWSIMVLHIADRIRQLAFYKSYSDFSGYYCYRSFEALLPWSQVDRILIATNISKSQNRARWKTAITMLTDKEQELWKRRNLHVSKKRHQITYYYFKHPPPPRECFLILNLIYIHNVYCRNILHLFAAYLRNLL